VQINPLEKTVLGIFLIIVGLVMIIFHQQLKQMTDDWYEHLPSVIWRGPTGTLLTVTIIVFGAISILIGVTQLLLAFAPQ
jgi:uncharacterized membrane protein